MSTQISGRYSYWSYNYPEQPCCRQGQRKGRELRFLFDR